MEVSAPVDDAYGLAFAARHGAELDDVGADANAELFVQHTLTSAWRVAAFTAASAGSH